MKYLLFDIDGTLMDSGGAGMRSMDLAFEEIFSVARAFAPIQMAGKTDLQILRECFDLHGIPATNGEVPAFFSSYTKFLSEQMDSGRARLKPGVREVLDRLWGREECVIGLLTGNIEQGAFIKLNALGIGHFFEIGAFGNEHENRNMLLPIAVEKLQSRKALRADYADCVIIGDTPKDVECAKPYGAHAVAVATGPYSEEVLAAAGADAVFPDLSDTAKVLGALGMKP